MADGPARKKVLLGMPSHGDIAVHAARALFRSTADRFDVHIMQQIGSLLAQNMNILWCEALNRARSGPGCDYFAMLHGDCQPEDFWLDKLIDEMEAKDLDVLGVVSPIKDQRGRTSIALARPDGNTWRVHARLTMKEVCRLPETFTSEDVGYPLLLNTGCWVCRFDEERMKKFHFEVNDRIIFNTKYERYIPECEPEDWNLSRCFHEYGLKIGATRKIKMGHRGPINFGNQEPWGDPFDSEYLSESVLDKATAEPDFFPHEAVGWMTEGEGRELGRLAAGKNVLEIGSYCGRSTVCLARTAKCVHALDTFDGRGTPFEGDTLETFQATLKRYGVSHRVSILKGEAAAILPTLPPVFDLVFIDGSHDYESVAADIEHASRVLKRAGVLVFHDYGRSSDPGVTQAVSELLAGGGELLGVCETLAVVRPPARVLTEV
jgi:SAM-dependent methyltransferase